jgi:6-pyruvoyltetrahydropterin/6-carboxytetrahydropterin synthase
MPLMHVIRRERFSAAHRMGRPDWSQERNAEVYGKCANANWHGHNYVLWVNVKGRPDPETSYVVDLGVLSTVIKEHVIDHLDHRNLDLDVPWLKGRVTSTETLTVAIWERLVEPIRALGVELYSVRVEETENNHVEYHGE